MNTVRKIAKNTLVLLVAQIVSMGLGFFYIMYTARYLGAEGFGVLSFALAFTGMFGVFVDMGLSTLTTREVARDKSLAGKYLGNVAVMKAVLVVITFGMIAIAINLLGYPEQTTEVVYLIALSIIFSAFTGMFNSVFQAFEKMEYVSFGMVLSSMMMLAGGLIVIKQGYSVVGFASIYFIVSVISLGYAFTICSWKFVSPKIEVDLGFLKATIKEALPFGVSGIFIAIYMWTDSILLSFMKGNEVVGWYNAAYTLITVLLFIPSIINRVIYPIMSRSYIFSENSLNLIHRKYFKLMFTIGPPIGLGTILLADRIILLTFGEGYIQSIIALKILVWVAVFAFANSTFVLLFESMNKQIIAMKITGICVIENIILNLIIIPRFSYIGASITTVITQFTVLTLLIFSAYKIGYIAQRRDLLMDMSRPIIASLAMGVFILKLGNINLLVIIFLSILLYILVLHIVRGIDREDIELLIQIKRSKE